MFGFLVKARERDVQTREKDCERASSRAALAEAALAEAKQVRLALHHDHGTDIEPRLGAAHGMRKHQSTTLACAMMI